MIALKHLNKCGSILGPLDKLNLNQNLNFCVDTRLFVKPSAFVAIPGAKVNPLDLLDKVLSEGCPLVVYQQNPENDEKVKTLKNRFASTFFLAVKDSVTFLQELSHEHIVSWKNSSPKNTVFAISGSNGKTTHKEMLSFMLKKVLPGKIVSTEKNNNNHLGVPLTLLNVTEATEFVVLELGSNHPGEIKVLCDIAVPNAGLTTNIGATHLEFFGSEEQVFLEEGHLYHAVKATTHGQGFYLINMDDPYLSRFAPTPGSVSYGEASTAKAKVSFLPQGAEISYQGETFRAVNEQITGRHNKLNLVTCLFIACHFYPKAKEAFIEAGKEFKPTKNRSEWITFEERPVYLDAYNANPSSMKAALLGFKESLLEQGLNLEDACIVLGDMNELGDSAPQYHQEVGKYVGELGFKHVYFIGRYSSFYQQGFPQGKTRASSAEFKSEYRKDCLKKHRIHFIKGSRSLQLESLFDIT